MPEQEYTVLLKIAQHGAIKIRANSPAEACHIAEQGYYDETNRHEIDWEFAELEVVFAEPDDES